MAKKETKKGSVYDLKQKPEWRLDSVLSQRNQVILGLVLITAVVFLFFSPMIFGGKTVKSGDIISIGAMEQLRAQPEENKMLWNPYSFTGMPAQYIGGVDMFRWWNLLNSVYSQGNNVFETISGQSYTRNIFFYLMIGFTVFYFMRWRKASMFVAVLSALAVVLSTGLVLFLFIGHILKIQILCLFPLMLVLLYKLKEKITLLDSALLAATFGLMFYAWHVQVLFYVAFTVGLFFLYHHIRELIKKDFPALKKLVLSGAVVLATVFFALGTNTETYLDLSDYTPYSTRGTKGLQELTAESTGKQSNDAYEYATRWSFSPGEMMTFVIPSFYGHGNVTYSGPLTQNKPVEANFYFGPMDFVDVPMYMGVLIFFFGLFTIIVLRKDPLVQFLSILIGLALLISFGKNLPVLYDLFYYYVPTFDKFRVPSMMLTLVQVTLPLLAGLGIMKIISLRDERNEKLINAIKISAFVFSGLALLSLLLNSVLSSSLQSRFLQSSLAQQYGNAAAPLGEYIGGIFAGDTIIAFLITAAAFWLCTFYLNKKLSRDVLGIALVLLVVFDLARITGRGANYIEPQDVKSVFTEPAHVTAIKSQKDTDVFRIMDLRQDGNPGAMNHNSNYYSYFLIQDFNGYSGVKPRAVQDYLDIVSPANPTLWRMANIRYIILNQPLPPAQFPGLQPIYGNEQEKIFVYKNLQALPRAFFVQRTEVKPPADILQAVKNNDFDPALTAYTEKDVKADSTDSTASVTIRSYKRDIITIDVTASGNNFLVLTDTYYPPGWTASIDGTVTEIYRVNHGFRGVLVPKGKHVVEFTYHPESFYVGKNVSLAASALILLGIAGGTVLRFRKRKTEDPV